MRVITLHPAEFDRHCERLAKAIMAASPHGYDDAVAIRRGGVWVADAVRRHLPEGYLGRVHDVSLHRRFTEAKYKSPTISILRSLPRPLADVLRMVESRAGSLKSRLFGTEVYDFAFDTPIRGKRILVIDDSIDSGATVKAILNALPKGVNADVAVITVTRKHTLVRPHIALYDNAVLVRFPWSTDYKENDK